MENKFAKYSTTINIVIVVGGIAIVYFGIVNPVLKVVGIKKSAEDKAKAKLNEEKKRTAQQDAEKMKQQGIKPTYNAANYIAFADTIYEKRKFYFDIDNDIPPVIDVLMKMKKDLDVALLIQAYGTRNDLFFGFSRGEPLSLFAALRSKIKGSQLESINTDWARKNITYRI
jgi:hypothetical protein